MVATESWKAQKQLFFGYSTCIILATQLGLIDKQLASALEGKAKLPTKQNLDTTRPDKFIFHHLGSCCCVAVSRKSGTADWIMSANPSSVSIASNLAKADNPEVQVLITKEKGH